MYICKNNVLLEKVKAGILYDYEYEFFGRKANELFEDNCKKLESEYFQNDDYMMEGVYFSCDIELDEYNCIDSISIAKYKDKYVGHGRSVSDELSLNAKDLKAIKECLNNSVVQNQNDDYNALIESIKNRSKVKEYKIKKISAKGITLNKEKDFFVTKKDLLKVLNLSRSFIDILYDDALYKTNKDLIDGEIVKPLLAILSCYDYSKYPNIKKLEKEADIRKICFESKKGYELLIEALKDRNEEEIKKYSKFSIVVPRTVKENESPIIIALNNCKEQVRTLLEAGCYTNPSFFYKDGAGICRYETAIGIAYKNKDYESLKLIASYYDPTKMEHKPFQWDDTSSYDAAMRKYNASVEFCIQESFDEEALKILIPHMDYKGGLKLPSSYELEYEKIEFLAGFEGLKINWKAKHFLLAYPRDIETCNKMIRQGCLSSAINTFIDLNEYELFKYCAENYTEGQSYYFEKSSFIKLFSMPNKWYEIARKLEKDNFDYKGVFLDELKQEDEEKYKQIIEKYRINEQ